MTTQAWRRARRLLTGVVMVTGSIATSAGAASAPAAQGHGNLISGGELRTFSFTATRNEDGTVTGQVEVKNRALDVRAHMKLDCVKFDTGSRAILSGPITQSSDPGFILPGRIGVFGIEDNGEGDDAPADRITTIPDYAAPKSCDEFTFVGSSLRDVADLTVSVRTLTAIVDGNVQVQP